MTGCRSARVKEAATNDGVQEHHAGELVSSRQGIMNKLH